MLDEYKVVISIVAAFISLLALLVASYSIIATRKHYRLSLQPRFTTFTNATDQDETTGIALYKLVLKNSGLGPAFIKKFEVLIDETSHQPKKPEDFFKVVKDHLNADFAASPRYLAILKVGYVMAKDEEQILADIGFIRPPQDLDEQLKRIRLRITFESIYGFIDCYDTNDHQVETTDLSDLKLAAQLFCQRLKTVAFNRVPVLKLLR